MKITLNGTETTPQILALIVEALNEQDETLQLLKPFALAQQARSAEKAKTDASIAEIQHIVNSIPQETREALKAIAVLPDPTGAKPWFKIVRADGLPTISVKRLDDGFRIRLRNPETGELAQEECKVQLNALNATLAQIAAA